MCPEQKFVQLPALPGGFPCRSKEMAAEVTGALLLPLKANLCALECSQCYVLQWCA